MEPEKALERVELTDKARDFISLILAGVRPPAAHKAAGYEGSAHAAYELKSRLAGEIALEAERRGVSLDGIKTDLAMLDELPLKETEISIQDKLKLIAAKQKLVEYTAPPQTTRHIAAFVINRPAVVEAEVVKE